MPAPQIKILSLYLDEEDRLCTVGPHGQVIYLAVESGRVVETPGPGGKLLVGQTPDRTLFDHLTNG